MKKKLTNNLLLKIISLLGGILVWLIVANVDNPVIERTFTLQNVELVNEAYIDDTGKVCLKNGEQTSVRVTIRGESKTISRILATDIHLTADLQQAVSLETNPVMIPITAQCSGVPSARITVWPQNYSVTLEDKVSNEYMVAVSNGDSKAGRGYEVGTQTVSPDKVRITGPQSLIRRIDKVTANVNLDGTTQDRTDVANLTITDKNGDALSTISMSNLRIENDGRVTVATKLWRVRSNVRLSINYSGEPAPGFVVDSVTTVPETVSVAGSAEELEELRQQGNVIPIEDDSLNISGADRDVETKVNITQMLPEGIKLTSGSSDEVMISVNVLPDESRRFTIPTSGIKVNNKADNMQLAFDVDKVEIRVRSTDGEIEDFDEASLEASIDVSGKEEGNYSVPVKIILPEGYELVEKVTTEVTISKVSTAKDN